MIKVNFIYHGQKKVYFYEPLTILREIFQTYAAENEFDFNSIKFLLNGKAIENTDYDKCILYLFSNNKKENKELNIMVKYNFDSEEDIPENKDKDINVIFQFK